MPDLTITLTTEQATRARAVIGIKLRLTDGNGEARPATLIESKNYVASLLKNIVQSTEVKQQADAIVPAAFDTT